VVNYRRGLTPLLTLEGGAEATRGTFMAGGGAAINISHLALLNGAAAGSSGGGVSGAKFSANIQRTGQTVSLAAAATVSNGHFSDVAAVNGDAAPRRQFSANAGLSLRRYGSLGVAYAAIRRDAIAAASDPLAGIVNFQPDQNTRLLSASYSLQISGVALFLNAFFSPTF
jgi:outer membrane usher protein